MTSITSILAFYAFSPVEQNGVTALQTALLAFGKERDMRGLVILATEGINGTVCGHHAAIEEWRTLIAGMFADVTWNESAAEAHVFPRWLVKIREEIVALHKPDSSPFHDTHLTPEEWNTHMQDDDVVVIDTRNRYETTIGMFEDAIDPMIRNFQEFPTFAASCEIPKQKKVLLYCTGGIRCEKAVAAMKDVGYKNVFQLKGGILAYLKQFPNARFKGECFVFDHRVALDQRLQPSQLYKLCPACGDPATQASTCVQCSSLFFMCTACVEKSRPVTCSKNCRYHVERLTGAHRCGSSQ